MIGKHKIVCFIVAVLAISGCGGVKPVTGGTIGTLKVSGQLLSDIQVTVHRVEGTSTHPIGFGTTDQGRRGNSSESRRDGAAQEVTSPERLSAV